MRYCFPQIPQIYAELFSENLRDLREIGPETESAGTNELAYENTCRPWL